MIDKVYSIRIDKSMCIEIRVPGLISTEGRCGDCIEYDCRREILKFFCSDGRFGINSPCRLASSPRLLGYLNPGVWCDLAGPHDRSRHQGLPSYSRQPPASDEYLVWY